MNIETFFKYNPISPLLSSNNTAITYFLKHEILEKYNINKEKLWNLEEARKLLNKQNKSGYWISHSVGKNKHPAQNYDLLETFRHLNILIYKYGLTNEHPKIKSAIEHLFSCQTEEGDIRGIIGEQYAPYYNGIIASFLNLAGYSSDPRLEQIMQFLIDMRQNDGGWIIGSPGCMGEYTKKERYALTTQCIGTRQDFAKEQPFSHSGTGMVIRAFATHPIYRNSPIAKRAGDLLISHFFKKDNYTSYQHPDNWLRFKYPFWWTDLISALDSVSLLGFPNSNNNITNALNWFQENQLSSGLWKTSYSRIHKNTDNSKTYELQLWISLSILRIFRRFKLI